MQIRQDKYNLGQSSVVEINKMGEDVILNLQLNRNIRPINFAASVSGMVVDTLNKPIKNAIIKLMDSNFLPISHASTDANGVYIINDVTSSSSYNIIAVAAGKLLLQQPNFTLTMGESKTINFTLSDDNNIDLGVISGHVSSSAVPTSIAGAVVSLYSIVNDAPNLFAITYTDAMGDFILSELPVGNYTIKISALGYTPAQISTFVESGKIATVRAELSTSPDISNGIVSGIITNDSNEPIYNADVILYSVDANNSLTPVAFTSTNASGIYTFINVPLGTYLVKSNQAEVINVTNPSPTPPNNTPITSSVYSGPNIDKFTIAQPATIFPLSYNVASATLNNGAKINTNTNFVDFIGGANDGSATLDINVTTEGLYNLAINYISANIDRPLKVKVNDIDSVTIYNLPATADSNISSSKTFTLPVSLNTGNNTIIFHGTSMDYSPSLGNFNLTISPLSGSINLINGTFENNSNIDPTTGLVTGIGGLNNGIISTNITVNQGSQYNLAIQYLAGDGPKNLLVDINGVNTGTIYNLPQTLDWSVSNASIFNFLVNLNSGPNTIKFYGDGVNPSADLGTLYFTQVQFSTVIDASTTQ